MNKVVSFKNKRESFENKKSRIKEIREEQDNIFNKLDEADEIGEWENLIEKIQENEFGTTITMMNLMIFS